ncbi:MAG: HD domain-containing protein [Treponema sp.]|nr:HD domain-containing protein [Treponema sp.]
MSSLDEEFFEENIVKVNRMVEVVLFGAIFVPVVFFVFTLVGIWRIPHYDSLSLFIVGTISFLITFICNKLCKFQKFIMYFGIISSALFVGLMGSFGIINLSISYAFAPMLSCLYYNKRLTKITNAANFVFIIGVSYIGAAHAEVVTHGLASRMLYFVRTIIGFTIEGLFLFLISNELSKKSWRTLSNLVRSKKELDFAYEKQQERNKYIVEINQEMEKKNKELDETQYKIIQFVAQCLGSHDLFTGRHVIHTQKYVEIIAKELKDEGHYVDVLTDENIRLFQAAAFLHDIGKIHVPEGVLNKIGKFTPEEFEIMKSHPAEGKKLLEYLPPIEGGRFNEIAVDMCYCHHEKWDGTGYPNGLAGEDIPLSARIMAAADVLDALTSQRLYKDPMSVDEAIEVFRKSSGIHFEPCIAQAVINCKPLITLIDNDFKTAEANTNAEELEWWKKYHESLKKIQA